MRIEPIRSLAKGPFELGANGFWWSVLQGTRRYAALFPNGTSEAEIRLCLELDLGSDLEPLAVQELPTLN